MYLELKGLFFIIFVVMISFVPAFSQMQDVDNDGIPDSTDKCPSLDEDYLGTKRFDGCPNAEIIVHDVKPKNEISPTKKTFDVEITSGFEQNVVDSETNTDLKDEIEPGLESTQTETTGIKIPDLSELSSFDYFDKLIRDITEQASFYDLIIFSISMVIYAVFIFHFYRFIARRGIFSFDVEKRILGGKYKASGEKISATPRVAAFIGTKFVIFPFVIFGWFVTYSFFILLMSQDTPPERIFFISAILIIAIRITSYYSEDLSKDLAKTIPFSILGIFLFDQTFFTLEDVQRNLLQLPEFAVHIGAFLVLAISIEIILSIAYLVKLKISSRKQKKNDSDSEQPITNSQSS